MEGGSANLSHFDKKRTVVLLRSVVVISTSYLILFGEAPRAPASITYVLTLILTDIALALTPRQCFHWPAFATGLLLGDTAAVLVGLYLTVGCFSQDFLIIYFFTIFLTTATASLAEIAIGAAMVSGLYGYWLWLTAAHTLSSGEWLRLPFFFIVAVFYAFVTEEMKMERLFRVRAERESERLRFLFNLGNAVPQCVVAEEIIGQMARLVEAAFPRLRCGVGPEAVSGHPLAVFPLRSNDRSFGALRVSTRDGMALGPHENAFCHLAATMAANALYTAEQVNAAADGTRVKDEFLATLSHELRSPLHVIMGNAEILDELLTPTADVLVRESIERLKVNACRMLDLIEEMLCFAELRAGRTAVQREAVDLRSLFGECSVTMLERLAGRPIVFEWSVADNVPALQTDVRKLRMIVNGLLSNAAKFTEQGFVQLRAEHASSHIEIVVRDSGIGIAPKDLVSIFQAFRQLDGSLTRRFQGIGLGLALARELAGTLGGMVDVESAPNQGSTFRVRLPVAVAPAPATETETVAQPVAAAQLRWETVA